MAWPEKEKKVFLCNLILADSAVDKLTIGSN